MNNQKQHQGGKTLLTIEVMDRGLQLTTHGEAMKEKLQELEQLRHTSSENIWFTEQGHMSLMAIFLIKFFSDEEGLGRLLYQFYQSFNAQEMQRFLDQMERHNHEVAH